MQLTGALVKNRQEKMSLEMLLQAHFSIRNQQPT